MFCVPMTYSVSLTDSHWLTPGLDDSEDMQESKMWCWFIVYFILLSQFQHTCQVFLKLSSPMLKKKKKQKAIVIQKKILWGQKKSIFSLSCSIT